MNTLKVSIEIQYDKDGTVLHWTLNHAPGREADLITEENLQDWSNQEYLTASQIADKVAQALNRALRLQE